MPFSEANACCKHANLLLPCDVACKADRLKWLPKGGHIHETRGLHSLIAIHGCDIHCAAPAEEHKSLGVHMLSVVNE